MKRVIMSQNSIMLLAFGVSALVHLGLAFGVWFGKSHIERMPNYPSGIVAVNFIPVNQSSIGNPLSAPSKQKKKLRTTKKKASFAQHTEAARPGKKEESEDSGATEHQSKVAVGSKDFATGNGAPSLYLFRNSIVYQVAPHYPREALKKGWEDKLRLRFKVSSTGEVDDVQIIRHAKRKVFDRSALHAARSWKFQKSKTGYPYFVEKDVVFRIKN